jgi:DNA polymerase-3 subunit epsilon
VCDALLEFIGDAVLVAHNAGFDRGFVNHELKRANRPILEEARWIDSLPLAQKKFPGMYNSLDALCKRFKISLADRTKHGALLDAQLLAGVYLELRGGKERGLDLAPQVQRQTTAGSGVTAVTHGPRTRPLAPRSTEEERAAHEAFVRGTIKSGALWSRYGVAVE